MYEFFLYVFNENFFDFYGFGFGLGGFDFFFLFQIGGKCDYFVLIVFLQLFYNDRGIQIVRIGKYYFVDIRYVYDFFYRNKWLN